MGVQAVGTLASVLVAHSDGPGGFSLVERILM
jgi:hypothetical protein